MPLSIALAVLSVAAVLQQQPDNTAWLSFADSLSRSTDTRRLKQSADQLRRQRDFRSRIRAGLMYHRVYEIEHRQDLFDRAAGLLKDGLRQAPKLPAIYYLAGRALATGPHITERNGIVTLKVIRNAVGTSERDRGIAALESALQFDPMFRPAAIELARQAIEYRDEKELRRARAVLRPIVDRTGDEQARVLLAEIERRLGDPSAAAATLGAEPAGDAGRGAAAPSRVEYQRAMALMLVPERALEGAAAYWRGVASLDPESAQSWFDDLSYIASRNDARTWADTRDKAAWLRRFWAVEAARSGISVDDRIIVHYQRLAHAREKYPRTPSLTGRAVSRTPSQGSGAREIVEDTGAYRRDIDDRGLVWIKYGAPDHRVTAGLEYEAWVYERDGRNINFFFTIPGQDNPSAADGYSLFSGVTSCVNEGLTFLMNVARYEPELQKIYTGVCRNPGASNLAFSSTSATLSERARDNLQHNDARPRFEKDVPFHYTLYTLDAPGEASTVVAALAIPAERLVRDNRGQYAFRASLVVTDTILGTVSRADTILYLPTSRALRDHEYLRTYLQLTTRPSGAAIYRISIVDVNAASAGGLYGGVRAVDAFANRLGLSDLILADTAERGGWRRGRVTLELVPMEEYPGGAFNLFYEVYNLPAGSYRTQVRIEPIDGATRRLLERALGRNRGSIELAFDGQTDAARDVTQELRRVGTELPAGRYRITVKVTDSRGVQAERTRILRVSKADR